jgi:hypothetical protein
MWTYRLETDGTQQTLASRTGNGVLIGPFLPKFARRKDDRECPWRENRAVLNGILWILRTGAP